MASVDTRTGNTVLFSLPRNLQHVRFPKAARSPSSSPTASSANCRNGRACSTRSGSTPSTTPRCSAAAGTAAGTRSKDAIGHTLGLKIDYYALVNMYGFAALMDAIGGLKIRVERDIKWGGLYGTAGTIKAGYRRLSAARRRSGTAGPAWAATTSPGWPASAA